jgi:hypothetical protein
MERITLRNSPLNFQARQITTGNPKALWLFQEEVNCAAGVANFNIIK